MPPSGPVHTPRDTADLLLLPEWGVARYLLAERIRRIIDHWRIDCVIDAGANTGQYARFIREQVGYRGLIVSFEPDPACFERLREAAAVDDQWLARDHALGSEAGTLSLNIMRSSIFNSFLEPDHSGTDRYRDLNTVKTTREVPVRRLDELLPALRAKHGFERVFLKLDTQGFDLRVFAGTSGCRDSIAAIQAELSVLAIYKDMPGLEETLHTLRSAGYEVSGLYPVEEKRFPYAMEFDGLFVRRDPGTPA